MITSWDYIRQLFQPTDRVVVLMRKKGNPILQRFLEASKAAAEPFQKFLRHQNAQGADIWIGINPLRPGARSRTKENIDSIRRIYLDIDLDGEAVLNRVLTDPALPQPNYVLNTSESKYQVIWNVTAFSPQVAESTTRRLAHHYGADTTVFDIARVLRLPGFHNKKYSQTFRITATRLSTKIYQPQHFILPSESSQPYNPNPETQPSSPKTVRPKVSSPDTSPSGRDFGACCHAIWHAFKSNHNIDSFCASLTADLEQRARARKKPDPVDYAARTVRNARLKIENQLILNPIRRSS